MTEEQLHKQTQQREQNASADKSPENKRRRLIKGAVAIPVIMTLHSGAALARSSNIVGAITNPDLAHKVPSITVESKENIVCFKHAVDLKNGQYDLGKPIHTVPEIMLNEGGKDVLSIEKQVEQCLGPEHNGFMISAKAWEASIGAKFDGSLM